MKISPYLSFNGNCEEAMKFYERALGGKLEPVVRFESTPAAEHVPADWRGKVMHSSLTVGDFMVMASDAPPGRQEPMKGITVALNVDKPADADRIFKALSEKGTVTMPIQETFWAARFGMFTDRFGTPWMINAAKPT
jgi:PhnB protein